MEKTSEIIWQDAQHQELFRIFDLIKSHPGKESSEKLISYVEYHFSLEEEYMGQLDYPFAAEHIKQHREFEENVKKYVTGLIALGEDCDEKIMKNYSHNLSEYLSQWFINHVFGIDKDFEKFVLESQKK